MPAGPASGRVLAGFHRRSTDRGCGQAAPCSELAGDASLANKPQPGADPPPPEEAPNRAWGNKPSATIIHEGLARTGYREALNQSDDKRRMDKIENIDELISDAHEFMMDE